MTLEPHSTYVFTNQFSHVFFSDAIFGRLIFWLEAVSVIIQVTSFKLTGKWVPIHYHFEQKGWTKTQIVVRFWILAIIFALMALGTLKLR